ncbi:MAG: aldo/keto reductase [Lachnospiraceae bacterium]|nr:aldo/keto reductase [Lachnospiraceae bacterium]
MQYRNDRHQEPISILGYGCMRFTTKGRSIDIDKAEKELMSAYEAGVNYYDTAYIYTGSEAALGEIFARTGIRDKINIATKLPQYMIGSRAAVDRYFNEELSRLRTDHIDYYLMHMLTDVFQWERLLKLGITEWIAEKKAAGQIRNIGFSFHGNTEMFLKILDAYDWDFCQIQYNYLDEVSQAGVKGLKAAAAKCIPVIIMEPLRGGKLVNMLPESARKVMAASGKGWSAAEWGLRWLYNQPEVTCVLSGMNSLEMVEENCRIASEAQAGSWTADEFEVIRKVCRHIRAKEKVGCTGCRYCMPCSKNVDIPGAFRCWNEMYIESKSKARFAYAQTVGMTKEAAFPSQCVECGKCEKHCPQGLPIRDLLKKADKDLRPLPYKIGINVARKFMMREVRNSSGG